MESSNSLPSIFSRNPSTRQDRRRASTSLGHFEFETPRVNSSRSSSEGPIDLLLPSLSPSSASSKNLCNLTHQQNAHVQSILESLAPEDGQLLSTSSSWDGTFSFKSNFQTTSIVQKEEFLADLDMLISIIGKVKADPDCAKSLSGSLFSSKVAEHRPMDYSLTLSSKFMKDKKGDLPSIMQGRPMSRHPLPPRKALELRLAALRKDPKKVEALRELRTQKIQELRALREGHDLIKMNKEDVKLFRPSSKATLHEQSAQENEERRQQAKQRYSAMLEEHKAFAAEIEAKDRKLAEARARLAEEAIKRARQFRWLEVVVLVRCAQEQGRSIANSRYLRQLKFSQESAATVLQRKLYPVVKRKRLEKAQRCYGIIKRFILFCVRARRRNKCKKAISVILPFLTNLNKVAHMVLSLRMWKAQVVKMQRCMKQAYGQRLAEWKSLSRQWDRMEQLMLKEDEKKKKKKDDPQGGATSPPRSPARKASRKNLAETRKLSLRDSDVSPLLTTSKSRPRLDTAPWASKTPPDIKVMILKDDLRFRRIMYVRARRTIERNGGGQQAQELFLQTDIMGRANLAFKVLLSEEDMRRLIRCAWEIASGDRAFMPQTLKLQRPK